MEKIFDEIKGAEKLLDQLQKLMGCGSDGHGYDHVIRVTQTAIEIAQTLLCNMQVVILAALLHDADDGKLFNTVNNANARKLMAEIAVDDATIEWVVQAINEVSFSHNGNTKPSTIEGAIVRDADRLDAIGAIGIARTFAYGGSRGNSLDTTIQHFSDKLLGIKNNILTVAGRAMAEKRHDHMIEFLQWYSHNE